MKPNARIAIAIALILTGLGCAAQVDSDSAHAGNTTAQKKPLSQRERNATHRIDFLQFVNPDMQNLQEDPAAADGGTDSR